MYKAEALRSIEIRAHKDRAYHSDHNEANGKDSVVRGTEAKFTGETADNCSNCSIDAPHYVEDEH